MEKQEVIKNWEEKRKRLKNRYDDLTEKDLKYVVGEENKLIDRIRRRLGTSRKKTRNILREI